MKIIFIIPRDFRSSSGAAEPAYLHEYLSDNYETTTIFASKGKSSNKQGVWQIPKEKPIWWSLIPFWIYFDFQVMKTLPQIDINSEDVLWTYRGLFLSPLWIKWRFGCRWILDMRTPPVEQDIEFHEEHGRLDFKRLVYYTILKNIYYYIFPYTDSISVVSPALEEYLIDAYSVSPDKVYVQSLGVDLKKFNRQKDYNFNKDDIKLVYVTTIAMQRGIDCLFGLLQVLQEDGVDVDLQLVGSGEKYDMKYLRGLANDMGVSENVHWVGHVPHDKIPSYIERCDIALSPLPDLFSYRVSSPTKIFEYLALELPIIASDIRAHREIINHEKNGLLVPPSEPEAWAEAVQRLYEDSELRRQIQQNSRKSVLPYHWEKMLGKLDKALLATEDR